MHPDAPTAADASERDPSLLVHPASRTSTRASFLGPPGRRLFICYHAPEGADAEAAVLICPPICAEATRNYRREVLVARELAERGIASLRFHYYGSGNSDGCSKDLAIPQMVEDAKRTAAHLLELTGAVRFGVLGTRLGASIATDVGVDHSGAPLALWEPVARVDRYFREVFRARMITDLKHGSAAAAGAQGLLAQLQQTGWLDVCGYPISRQLYETAMNLDLARANLQHRPVLLVEMNNQGTLRKETSRLVEQWGTVGGPTLQTQVIEHTEPWWFGATGRGGRLQAVDAAQDLVATTTGFFERWLVKEPVHE